MLPNYGSQFCNKHQIQNAPVQHCIKLQRVPFQGFLSAIVALRQIMAFHGIDLITVPLSLAENKAGNRACSPQKEY